MKKTTIYKSVLLAAFSSAIIYSCTKEDNKIDTETQSAVDNTIAEAAFSQIFPMINEIGVNEEGVNRSGVIANGNSCATISISSGDTANFPDSGAVTILIDFGANGCLDSDNRFRKGKVYAKFSDKWKNAGATVEVTLDGYHVDNVKYEGKMNCTNNGNYTFTRSVVNGKCTAADFTVEYSGTHTVQQTEGFDTKADASDDVYKITGNSTGKNRKDKTFTTLISTPLIKRTSCKWIESGVFEITPQDLATRIVNYGDGTCDSKATITINGNVYDFDMK